MIRAEIVERVREEGHPNAKRFLSSGVVHMHFVEINVVRSTRVDEAASTERNKLRDLIELVKETRIAII